MNEGITNAVDNNTVTRKQMRRLLWDWGTTYKTISRYESELRELSSIICDAYNTLSAQTLDGMPHSSSVGDPTGKAAVQIEKRISSYKDLSARTDDMIARILRRKHYIDNLMLDLPLLQQNILSMRYRDRKTYAYIGIVLNYDERSIERFELLAIDKLRNVVLSNAWN